MNNNSELSIGNAPEPRSHRAQSKGTHAVQHRPPTSTCSRPIAYSHDRSQITRMHTQMIDAKQNELLLNTDLYGLAGAGICLSLSSI